MQAGRQQAQHRTAAPYLEQPLLLVHDLRHGHLQERDERPHEVHGGEELELNGGKGPEARGEWGGEREREGRKGEGEEKG